MGEGIGYRGNCRGCLYLTESFIVGKEESSITLQRPSKSSTELIIATCPALPLESNEGELLGLGATPGSNITALKRSRLSRGSSVRLCSGSSPALVDVVLSIPAAFALTVACC